MKYSWGDIEIISIQKMFLNNQGISVDDLESMKNDVLNNNFDIYHNQKAGLNKAHVGGVGSELDMVVAFSHYEDGKKQYYYDLVDFKTTAHADLGDVSNNRIKETILDYKMETYAQKNMAARNFGTPFNDNFAMPFSKKIVNGKVHFELPANMRYIEDYALNKVNQGSPKPFMDLKWSKDEMNIKSKIDMFIDRPRDQVSSTETKDKSGDNTNIKNCL